MTVENYSYRNLDPFEEACRRADKERRRRPDNPRIARARQLLADDVSLERALAAGERKEQQRKRRSDVSPVTQLNSDVSPVTHRLAEEHGL